jgi:bifunctional UDP-N-acetylglucosamine pyrophosphorylase/glucosamine-1-phosphate N-acetyltransferase
VTGPAAVIVLAAGEGTRMRSGTAKVLHEIAGRSLLGHALVAAHEIHPEHVVVVVRHAREQVISHLRDVDPDALIADQDELRGTGRAVVCGLESLARHTGAVVDGTVVVTYGDVPLLTGHTLAALVAEHEDAAAAVTVLTAVVDDPTGYGRVVRDATGGVRAIVEDRDADGATRELQEINSGIYAFDGAVLRDALARVGTDNAQGEMYLTDVLGIAREDGRNVQALPIEDVWQVEGVNDRVQLATLGAELNRRLLVAWMRAGVTVVDPSTTWVDVDVRLAPDVTLMPGVMLREGTTVATGAVVGPDTTLTRCEIGAGAEVIRSHGAGARVGAGASVGPFSYLRPGTSLGADGKIGAFVETKNARIGDGSKVPHLSYVGDATIGTGSNVGAATIFVNYDGVAKHHTQVGDHVRIGSDTMLVAPVTIGDGAYTAAGSVITEDVPPGALGVARAPQHVSEGWTRRRRPGTASAKAAEAAAPGGPERDPEGGLDGREHEDSDSRPGEPPGPADHRGEGPTS